MGFTQPVANRGLNAPVVTVHTTFEGSLHPGVPQLNKGTKAVQERTIPSKALDCIDFAKKTGNGDTVALRGCGRVVFGYAVRRCRRPPSPTKSRRCAWVDTI